MIYLTNQGGRATVLSVRGFADVRDGRLRGEKVLRMYSVNINVPRELLVARNIREPLVRFTSAIKVMQAFCREAVVWEI